MNDLGATSRRLADRALSRRPTDRPGDGLPRPAARRLPRLHHGVRRPVSCGALLGSETLFSRRLAEGLATSLEIRSFGRGRGSTQDRVAMRKSAEAFENVKMVAGEVEALP